MASAEKGLLSKTSDAERLPPGSPCTQCGKCCTNDRYMLNLTAEGEDVLRWRREGRVDILRFVEVIGPPESPYADLWIDQDSGDERSRCPFVQQIEGTKKFTCTIYETRPQICRQYEPWSPLTICEVV